MDEYREPPERISIENLRELTDELKKLNRNLTGIYELLRQRLR